MQVRVSWLKSKTWAAVVCSESCPGIPQPGFFSGRRAASSAVSTLAKWAAKVSSRWSFNGSRFGIVRMMKMVNSCNFLGMHRDLNWINGVYGIYFAMQLMWDLLWTSMDVCQQKPQGVLMLVKCPNLYNSEVKMLLCLSILDIHQGSLQYAICAVPNGYGYFMTK